MKKVLFVCTGNTCRSPMAEAIFNHLAKNMDYIAISCGINADGVSGISENAKKALYDIGVDFEHTSTPVTKDLVEDSSLIIGITENHARTLMLMFPEHSDKIFAMPKDIPDPYGQNLETYIMCRDEILECVKSTLKVLTGEGYE